MDITLNNKIINIPRDLKITELLNLINSSKSVIIFINGKKLLYSQYDNYILSDGDTVKVIKPLGGG